MVIFRIKAIAVAKVTDLQLILRFFGDMNSV